MDNSSTGFNKSVLINSGEGDPLPINGYKLSNEDIRSQFHDINEDEIEGIKNDLLILFEILYYHYGKEE